MTFAFVPAVARATEPEMKPALPTFTRRWWFSDDRLDARPVMWSLRNRPEEWTATDYRVTHTPSKHGFWIAGGWGFYCLDRAEHCSCKRTEGRFQPFQQWAFGRAYKAWRAWDRARQSGDVAARNAQFASHFIR